MATSKTSGGKSKRASLVLVGSRRPQLRQARAAGWTKAKQRDFLSVLADTCNVSRACADAGVSTAHAYRLRAQDAAFRAAWREAVGVAYQRLELVLLDRAFNGTEKVIKRKDGGDERMVEYSNQLGLALLKMHRDTAVEANLDMAPADADEIREKIIGKLRRLKQRMEREAEEAGEGGE